MASTISKDALPPHNRSNTASIDLGYGADKMPFRYDPEQFSVLVPNDFMGGENKVDLDEVIDNPIGSPSLTEIVKRDDKVVIVVPDATRAAGVDRIAPLLLSRLRACGITDNRISIVIGGGIHRLPTQAEIHAILGSSVAERIAVYGHEANDSASLVYIGKTTRGTPVEINRRVAEADRVIIIGGIGFHYFAGFSGGRKAIMPGCASERSIRANHLLSFDLNTLSKRVGVSSGRLDGNAVHEDMEEAVGLINPAFLINTVVDSKNEITAAYAGHWRMAHRYGCEQYAASHSIKIKSRRPLVIVSCGGAPRDINLIQSHKAMEHASGALEENGTMIVLAECGQGLGRSDFLDWFVPGGARATAQKLVKNYVINGQTAWGLRSKAERFRILLISSLDDDVVRKMGLEPHRSLDSAFTEIGSLPGYIIPGGTTTLPEIAL